MWSQHISKKPLQSPTVENCSVGPVYYWPGIMNQFEFIKTLYFYSLFLNTATFLSTTVSWFYFFCAWGHLFGCFEVTAIWRMWCNATPSHCFGWFRSENVSFSERAQICRTLSSQTQFGVEMSSLLNHHVSLAVENCKKRKKKRRDMIEKGKKKFSPISNVSTLYRQAWEEDLGWL